VNEALQLNVLTPDDEARLLRQVAGGDRAAFRALFFVYHRRLARFLHRMIRERESVEELVNDTMLVVWQRAADFRGASRPSTWILGIAYRRALKALERASARPTEPLESWTEHVDAAEADPLAAAAERSQWIDQALDALSPEHRLVIELAYYMGLSCEEIAGVAECPVATVKTRMFYARQRLRDQLAVRAAPCNAVERNAMEQDGSR